MNNCSIRVPLQAITEVIMEIYRVNDFQATSYIELTEKSTNQ